MSPTRIGSIVLTVLSILPMLYCVADLDQLDVALGLLGGDARGIRASKIVIFICGRAPWRRVTLTWTSRRSRST